MDLRLDESQELLASSFADFFAGECPTSHVRDCEAVGFSPELWKQFAELGAPGMGLSEEAGGLGMGLLELGLVAAACGRAVAPLPFAEVAVANRVIAPFLVGDSLLERLAGGEERIGIALPGGALPGEPGRHLASYGAVVEHVVGLDGEELVLVSGAGGRETERLPELGSGAPAIWNLGQASGGERRVLATGAEAVSAFERGVTEWKLLAAFALVGIAQRALEIGVEYAKERIQFQVAIGSFQSIAHPLADCATRVDGAELLAWEAAWADVEEPARFEELAAMAYVFASQTAQLTTSVSLHTHGGYGFSEEYDIQLYYRRACAWSLIGGGARDGLVDVADRRFGGAASAAQGGR